MIHSVRPRPFAGVKVVELPGLAPVPFCGRILADFGADVVLVEKENDRKDFDGYKDDIIRRGKRTMRVNFRSPQQTERLRAVCETADVLLDPFRPGTLAKMGLDPVKLIEKNPKLIIAMISSYGQDGPYYAKAGHDLNFLSLSGVMPAICGDNLKPPANLLGDFAGGSLLAAFGICAELFRRQRGGPSSAIGSIIDCSMTEGIAYLGTFVTQHADAPLAFNGEFAIFSGKCPIYRTYETKDGKFMAVAALETKFQRNLFVALDLNAEEAIAEMFAQPAEFSCRLAEIFTRKTQAEWTSIFYEADACVTPVLDLDTVGDFSQHSYRNFFTRRQTAEGAPWIPGPAPRIWTIEEFRSLQEKKRRQSKI